MMQISPVLRARASWTAGRLTDVVSFRTVCFAELTRCAAAIALMMSSLCAAIPALGGEPPGEATIQAETKARLTLQSQISSKLSEAGDAVTATLTEPLYVEGEMVLPRGAEFHGRIVQIAPAKRGQRSSSISIEFERVITASGSVPISAQVTAIDDWDKEESIKADSRGKMKGGHRGEKTIENMQRGTALGFPTALIGAAIGGAAGSSGRQALGIGGVSLAIGMIGGILLTKGSDIRVAQGSILRIKFRKPVTLAAVQQPGTLRTTDRVGEARPFDRP